MKGINNEVQAPNVVMVMNEAVQPERSNQTLSIYGPQEAMKALVYYAAKDVLGLDSDVLVNTTHSCYGIYHVISELSYHTSAQKMLELVGANALADGEIRSTKLKED